MTINQLYCELKIAMKEQNKIYKDVVGGIITRAKNMAIEAGDKDNITEAIVNDAILKEQKICKDMIESCPADREDNRKLYELCLHYVNELAPKMLSEAEIVEIVVDAITEIEGPVNKGSVMKIVMPKVKGKADGKLVNEIVTKFVG